MLKKITKQKKTVSVKSNNPVEQVESDSARKPEYTRAELHKKNTHYLMRKEREKAEQQ